MNLSGTDLAYAMRPGGRFVTYRGDGTPLGDSLARIASSAATELEGGDFVLGDRMLRFAVWRGWPLDQGRSKGDLLELLNLTQEPETWLRLLRPWNTGEPRQPGCQRSVNVSNDGSLAPRSKRPLRQFASAWHGRMAAPSRDSLADTALTCRIHGPI